MDVLVSGYTHRVQRIYRMRKEIPSDVARLILAFYVLSLSPHDYIAILLNEETNSGHFQAFSLRTDPITPSKEPPRKIACGKPGFLKEQLGTTLNVFKLSGFPDAIRNNLFPKYQQIPFSKKKNDELHVVVRIEGENQEAPYRSTAYCIETDDLCVLPYPTTSIDRCGLLQSQKHGLLALGGYDYKHIRAFKHVQVLKSREEVMTMLFERQSMSYHCGYTSPSLSEHGLFKYHHSGYNGNINGSMPVYNGFNTNTNTHTNPNAIVNTFNYSLNQYQSVDTPNITNSTYTANAKSGVCGDGYPSNQSVYGLNGYEYKQCGSDDEVFDFQSILRSRSYTSSEYRPSPESVRGRFAASPTLSTNLFVPSPRSISTGFGLMSPRNLSPQNAFDSNSTDTFDPRISRRDEIHETEVIDDLSDLIWVNDVIPDMQIARSNVGALVLEDEGLIFVCGGWVSAHIGDTNTTELYSFRTDTVSGTGNNNNTGYNSWGMNSQWQYCSSMQSSHLCHGMCYDPYRKHVFVLGGIRHYQAHECEVFNFERNRWFKMPSTLSPHKWFPTLKLQTPTMMICCGNHYNFDDGHIGRNDVIGNGWGESEFLDLREHRKVWHFLDHQMSRILGYEGVTECEHKMRGLFAI